MDKQFWLTISVFCCVYFALVESAWTVEWNGSFDQNWNNNANWTGGSQPLSNLPATGDDAEISIGGSGNFPIISTAGEVARNVLLGHVANGQLEIRSGGALSARSLQVGETAGAGGTFLMTDGLLELSNHFQLGIAGNAFGIVTLSGGTVEVGNVNTGDLNDRRDVQIGVSSSNDADSTLVLDGTGVVQARDVVVGNGATGLNEFDVNGGLLDVRRIQLAHGADTIAFMVITGGEVQVAEDIVVADAIDSDGSIDVIDGSVTARSLVAAAAVDSLATITMVGGRIDTSGRGDVIIGQAGEAEMLLTGGTIHARSLAVALNDGDGSIELTDGLIQTDQDYLIGMDQDAFGIVDQSGGTTRIGGDLSLTGTSANASALYFLGGGTLDLTGGNVLLNSGTADFTFFGGRLQDVAVYGATLDNDGGTLAPGGSTGTTTIQGDYNQNAGAYEAEVDGASDTADVVIVQGTASLGGELQVVGLSRFLTIHDHSKTILTATAGVAGTFVDEPDTVPASDGGGTGHTGHGIFFKAIHYNENSVAIDLFQALAGDNDGDSDIDITDFNTLAVNFDPLVNNTETNDWIVGDYDIDGDIDITDFNALAVNFAPLGYAPTGPRIVPEPHAWMMVACGMVVLGAVLRVT